MSNFDIDTYIDEQIDKMAQQLKDRIKKAVIRSEKQTIRQYITSQKTTAAAVRKEKSAKDKAGKRKEKTKQNVSRSNVSRGAIRGGREPKRKTSPDKYNNVSGSESESDSFSN